MAEKRADYADRAIVEFTAAIYHYEQAGHERYCATNLNNLAMLLYQVGRYAEAHDSLDRAREIFERHADPGNLAQVNETRARVLVAEGHYKEAGSILPGVIRAFESGSDHALLADALTLQGVVWAKLGAQEGSLRNLRHAASIAQDSGALTQAGRAVLTLIEEHGQERLSEAELFDVYRRADELLKDTQDAEDLARLRACARVMGQKLIGTRLSDAGFALPDAVLAYEERFIREALEAEQGSISRAAKRLGIRHQSLIHTLKTRHKDLLDLRTPAKARRRSITRHGSKRTPQAAGKRARVAAILYVEDNKLVAEAVRETLELEGRHVVACENGATALKLLEGKEPFDLLLFDNDLPYVSGLELVRRARQLPHRRRTPIIMLSASDVEPEAWRAGVDAFLRKPDDVGRLAEMVTRLLLRKK